MPEFIQDESGDELQIESTDVSSYKNLPETVIFLSYE